MYYTKITYLNGFIFHKHKATVMFTAMRSQPELSGLFLLPA